MMLNKSCSEPNQISEDNQTSEVKFNSSIVYALCLIDIRNAVDCLMFVICKICFTSLFFPHYVMFEKECTEVLNRTSPMMLTKKLFRT